MVEKKHISEIKDLMQEWDCEANKDLDPTKINIGNKQKVWWKCSKCDYEWCTSIKHRTGKKKNGCPNCAMKQIEPPKAVEMIDIKSGKVIQEFSSIRIAKKITNISDSNIVEVCKGRRKTAGGYIWRYKK